ncbi:ATP cone domain-containing protein [Methanobacterium sp. ACI-7]|uniref:ATP cone domain-containing protein n=1 Tax=unclassified Methanobacterium TaxID=2627676 RepID=UPI0039C251DF
MVDVIKRNGKIEQFREEKIRISIQSAVRDAGYDIQEKQNLIDNTVDDVAENVRNVKHIEAKKIRDLILNDIEEDQKPGSSDIAAAWRNYEEKEGIEYKEETGDRQQILDSFKRKQ